MATIAEQLVDAQTAYHNLVTGRAARVVVDQNGERVEFVAANHGKLYSYIQELQRQIATSVGTPVTRGPAGFLF